MSYLYVVLLRQESPCFSAHLVFVDIIGNVKESWNDELFLVEAICGTDSMHTEVTVERRVRFIIENFLHHTSFRNLCNLAAVAQIFSEIFSTKIARVILAVCKIFYSLECFIDLLLLSSKIHLDLLLCVLSPLKHSSEFVFINLFCVCQFRLLLLLTAECK